MLAVEAEGHHEFARRVLAQLGRVLRYAVALGHAERDVAADLGDVLAAAQSTKMPTNHRLARQSAGKFRTTRAAELTFRTSQT